MTEITMTIDEKACVGCSLCVDVCPTKVLEWKEEESIPAVRNPKECFGCMSCSEICPATAIGHAGTTLSASYHHDRYALELAAKAGKSPRELNVPDDDGMIAGAMQDLGVRLLSVASVLKQTLGSSLPAVGTMAGMSLAGQLPRYQTIVSPEDAYEAVRSTFAPAWDLSFVSSQDTLEIKVTGCFVRTLCRKEGIALGGDLCTLFYHYMAGYLSKTGGKRPRLLKTVQGDSTCTYTVRLHG